MRRREFVTLVGGAAAWPVAARAQKAGKLPTVGFPGASTASTQGSRTTAFLQRLGELGWVDGRTVVIELRWTEGRSDRAVEIASEFVRLNVDVVLAAGAALALAAKQATSTIPIVFTGAGDPVATGLVASLARPGGNVTGLSIQAPDLTGKRLELLCEVMPALRRLAIMANAGNPTDTLQLDEARAAASKLGLEVFPAEIRRAEDIGPSFEALKGRADALYVSGDPLMVTNRIRINTLAQNARLPTIYNAREFVGRW
jgi:putative tryptophan/tyrosine transport system substrate-binding protein